jgi:cation transport ATPase
MQLVQQSALTFDKLDKSIQQQMLELVEKMDKNAFENAQTNLARQHEQRLRHIDHSSAGRKQILWVGGGLCSAAMVLGTLVTVLLINANQPQLAHTVMMSGLAVASALLGGAGFSSILRQLSGGAGKKDD